MTTKPNTFGGGQLLVSSKINENFDTAFSAINTLETVSNNGTIKNQNTGTLKFWTGTQAQYDAIVTKDSNTLYFII